MLSLYRHFHVCLVSKNLKIHSNRVVIIVTKYMLLFIGKLPFELKYNGFSLFSFVSCSWPSVNLSIGIGTDITNGIISTFARPMDRKRSRMVT